MYHDRGLVEMLLLDGGDGTDIARVTQNVKDKAKIVNFEKIPVIP